MSNLNNSQNFKEVKDISELIIQLKSPDEQIRVNAALALGQSNNIESISSLIEALDDASSDVTSSVYESLKQLSRISIEPLLVYLQHPDFKVRGNVIAILAQTNNVQVIKPLLEALNKTSEFTEQAFISAALGQLAILDIDLLINALKSPDPKIRSLIIGALGNVNERRVIDLIISNLYDNSGEVRTQAVIALEKFANNRDTLFLQTLAQTDEDETVKYLAKYAIEKIKKRNW